MGDAGRAGVDACSYAPLALWPTSVQMQDMPRCCFARTALANATARLDETATPCSRTPDPLRGRKRSDELVVGLPGPDADHHESVTGPARAAAHHQQRYMGHAARRIQRVCVVLVDLERDLARGPVLDAAFDGVDRS